MTRRAAPLLAGALLLGACTSSDPSVPTIEMWTQQTTPDRVAAQERVAAAFTRQTGIAVDVVALGAADQNQAFVTGAASGDVPDVILHAPEQTAAWRTQGLLDTELAGAIVADLGPATFNERALQMVTLDGQVGAVPSDGWVHLITYRQDLLDAAGLPVPTSLVELADTAESLAGGGVSGMALGTQPGSSAASEAIESTFLTAGCQLVTDDAVSIDADACTEAAEQFRRLAATSRAGEYDVPSARSAYLAGTAAMLLWSTHVLDELAGLDPANPLTCPQCADDPRFLADASGFITVLDEGNDAQYGSTQNYGIPVGAQSERARLFVEFMLDEGYVEGLGMATEGRLPVRLGTPQDPVRFVREWAELPFGVDREQDLSIADVYGQETVDALVEGMGSLDRWAFGTAQAPLEGAVFTQNVLPQHLADLYGGTPAEDVTRDMARSVTDLQTELGLR